MVKKLGLEEWTLSFLKELQTTYRWGFFDRRVQEETVLEHCFKQDLFTLIGVLLEPTLKKSEKILILGICKLHDLGEEGYKKPGEKLLFDVPYVNKNGRDKTKHVRVERERFQRLINRLDLPQKSRQSVLKTFREMYEKQYSTDKVGAFFNALERVGYVAKALYELKHGNKKFKIVLKLHCKELEKYSQKFIGIRALYQPMQKEVNKYL